jgi:protein gp37
MLLCTLHDTRGGHTFQVLTKRHERMRDYLAAARGRAKELASATAMRMEDGDRWYDAVFDFVSKNGLVHPLFWMGVSVENQEYADKRIPVLLDTPAAVRWVSVEPMLGPVNLRRVRPDPMPIDALTGRWAVPSQDGSRQHPRLNWCVVGGESGPGARPFAIQWARSIVEQCKATSTPVFVKQLGANAHDETRSIVGGWRPGDPEPDTRMRLHSKKGGNMGEWPIDLRVREMPEVTA